MKEQPEVSLFERIGGKSAVDVAVEIFYSKVLADESIRHFFKEIPIEKLVAKQKYFLTFALGGPLRYNGKNMQSAHARLVEKGLKEEHFDAVKGHLIATLHTLRVADHLIAEVEEIVESTRDDILGR